MLTSQKFDDKILFLQKHNSDLMCQDNFDEKMIP